MTTSTGRVGTGKKVSPQAKVGQRGVNVIERIVLEMGSAWHPTNQSLEVGIDGEIELVDPVTHEATNAVIRVQSKATTRRPLMNETDDAFDWPCDERDLEYWLSGNVPVILVVVRVDTGEAYWVCVGEYFKSPAQKKTRRVRFDKRSMALTSASYDDLARVAVPKERGLYSAPRPLRETLYSNLLEIAGLSVSGSAKPRCAPPVRCLRTCARVAEADRNLFFATNVSSPPTTSRNAHGRALSIAGR
jgi:hypothetical protein